MGACSYASLPETICGIDADHVMSYSTHKVVRIQDKSLGFTSMALMSLIFLYIVIFNIFYSGAHCLKTPVDGSFRLQWQEPTKECNPMHLDCEANYAPLTQLQYCAVFVGPKSSQQRNCRYYDAKDLPVELASGVLIPTFVKTFQQVPGCDASNTTNHSCARKYAFVDDSGELQSGKGEAAPVEESYVADVDSFSLLIDHNVVAGEENVEQSAMSGYFEDCHSAKDAYKYAVRKEDCVRKPVICSHSGCEQTDQHELLLQAEDRRLRSAAQTSAEEWARAQLRAASTPSHPSVISIGDGQVLSLTTMMAMAARSFDEQFEDAEDGNVSIRMRGTILSIDIEYNNWTPWTLRGMSVPEFTIRARSRKVPKYKHYETKATETGREILGSYGVLLVITQSGQLGTFKPVNLLVILTTSLGLLAVANTLTNFLAAHVMPRSDEYNKLMFQDAGLDSYGSAQSLK